MQVFRDAQRLFTSIFFFYHKMFNETLLTTGCLVSGSNSVELASVQRHSINMTPDKDLKLTKTGLNH